MYVVFLSFNLYTLIIFIELNYEKFKLFHFYDGARSTSSFQLIWLLHKYVRMIMQNYLFRTNVISNFQRINIIWNLKAFITIN